MYLSIIIYNNIKSCFFVGKNVKKCQIPLLFIHGTADSFVPYAMLDKNIEAYGGPYKEVLRVKGATHGQSVSQDLKLYLSTVQTFLNRWF